MPQSMTGFGRGEAEDNGLKATVEMRSVNHRFREVTVRIGRPYLLLEEKIKEEVLTGIGRGHLDIYVNLEDRRDKKRLVKLDKELAVDYYNCLREMADLLHLDYKADPSQLAQYPDLITVVEEEADSERVWPVVKEALSQALKQLMQMRQREGNKLYEDFIKRRLLIIGYLDQIRERVPQLAEELRIRLKGRMQTLLGEVEVDENRLLSEVVLYAERSSITEELVRLSSHLDQLLTMLNGSGPTGRKIEFLLQEMNREINTIGSKAADLVISPVVIEIKSELEKMREQAQNLE